MMLGNSKHAVFVNVTL